MANGRNWQSLSSGEIYGSLKIVCERNKVHFTSTGTRSDVFNKDSVSDDRVDEYDANESLTDDEVEITIWNSAEKNKQSFSHILWRICQALRRNYFFTKT